MAPCRELRGYADALPPAAAVEASWIRNAADWLDPVRHRLSTGPRSTSTSTTSSTISTAD